MEENKVCIEFESRSQNEGFARVAVSAFISQLDPTIEEIADVKTAVSEAVTNSIIHGYENDKYFHHYSQDVPLMKVLHQNHSL